MSSAVAEVLLYYMQHTSQRVHMYCMQYTIQKAHMSHILTILLNHVYTFCTTLQRKEMSEEEWRQRKLDKLLEGLKTDPNLAACRSIKRSEPMDGWTPMHAAAFKVSITTVLE